MFELFKSMMISNVKKPLTQRICHVYTANTQGRISLPGTGQLLGGPVKKVLIFVFVIDFSLQLIELVSDNQAFFLLEKKWASGYPKFPGPVLKANPSLLILFKIISTYKDCRDFD